MRITPYLPDRLIHLTALPIHVLKNLLAVVAGVIALILGVMFSVILLAVFCVIAVAALTFFWWKTRKLRKTMRDEARARPQGGIVIEGEAVVVEDVPVPAKDALPGDPPRQ